jgi:hypothetical protein
MSSTTVARRVRVRGRAVAWAITCRLSASARSITR